MQATGRGVKTPGRHREKQQNESNEAWLRQGQSSTARNTAGEVSNIGLGKDTAPQSAKEWGVFPNKRIHQ